MKQTMIPENARVEIQLLGGFSVKVDGHEIVNTDSGGQIWNLMEYLICHRAKAVSQEQLLEILWEDTVEDPAAALKNLVYRLRKAFVDAGVPYAKQLVVSVDSMYHWNNEVSTQVDIEDFEEACRAVEKADGGEEKEKLLSRAVELYTGEFLPGALSRIWVTPVNRYYHSLYYTVVYALLARYETAKNWEEMYQVAHRAAEIDVFEEDIHYYILLALSKLRRQSEAIRHYNYISDLYYRELGADLSPRLSTMFFEIAKSAKNDSENLVTLKDELREETKVFGAYYCEYEIFKSLYHVKARSVRREGDSAFLALLTVADPVPGAQLAAGVRNQAMQALHRAILESLRQGDIFSRCTGTQYVVLLSRINYENGEMVMSRILRRFKSFSAHSKVEVSVSLQPVEPV